MTEHDPLMDILDDSPGPEDGEIDDMDEAQDARGGSDRRQESERRCGMDRRCDQGGYEGLERRRREERRSGWDRRRGPGRRRSDERRSAEEGEMTDEQFEFLKAIEEYKKINKRPFPSFTEILEIAKALGYRKVAEPQSIRSLGTERREGP